MPGVARQALEPHIAYAPAIAGKVVERLQPIEMVDPKIRNCLRRSESNIYAHASAAVFLQR